MKKTIPMSQTHIELHGMLKSWIGFLIKKVTTLTCQTYPKKKSKKNIDLWMEINGSNHPNLANFYGNNKFYNYLLEYIFDYTLDYINKNTNGGQ